MYFLKNMERGWGREVNEKSFLHWHTQSSAGMISIKGWRGPPQYIWGSHSWQPSTDLEEGRYLEGGRWMEERRLIYIWDFMHVWIYEEGIQGHYLNHRNLGMRINGYSLPSPSGCCLQMHHWAMRQSIWGYAGRLFEAERVWLKLEMKLESLARMELHYRFHLRLSYLYTNYPLHAPLTSSGTRKVISPT